MVNITVSAKVRPELVQRISQTGFSTSDVMQVGLEMFLDLNSEQQIALMWDHIRRKKRDRAMERSRSRRKPLEQGLG